MTAETPSPNAPSALDRALMAQDEYRRALVAGAPHEDALALAQQAAAERYANYEPGLN